VVALSLLLLFLLLHLVLLLLLLLLLVLVLVLVCVLVCVLVLMSVIVVMSMVMPAPMLDTLPLYLHPLHPLLRAHPLVLIPVQPTPHTEVGERGDRRQERGERRRERAERERQHQRERGVAGARSGECKGGKTVHGNSPLKIIGREIRSGESGNRGKWGTGMRWPSLRTHNRNTYTQINAYAYGYARIDSRNQLYAQSTLHST
jgi:hypothetical protein